MTQSDACTYIMDQASRKLFLAALEADPNSSYSHKWMGIMLGKVSAIDGTKQQLIISPKIKVKRLKFKTFLSE